MQHFHAGLNTHLVVSGEMEISHGRHGRWKKTLRAGDYFVVDHDHLYEVQAGPNGSVFVEGHKIPSDHFLDIREKRSYFRHMNMGLFNANPALPETSIGHENAQPDQMPVEELETGNTGNLLGGFILVLICLMLLRICS